MEVLKTYKVKLVLNKAQKNKIDQWFYEGKCFYNYCLTQEDIFKLNACSIKQVTKLDKDGNSVDVELSSIPSKIKQNILRRMNDSIKGLSAAKANGRKVGRLKFKSQLPSLYFDNQSINIVNGRIRLAGFGRTHLKAYGLRQLGEDYSIRCATLSRADDGYYLSISIKRWEEPRIQTNRQVGLDFGIKTSITTSDGEKFNLKIPESKRLKRLQKKLARSKQLNSGVTKNQLKTRRLLRLEYQKITNRKKDFANKLIHHLDSTYDLIAFQDEQINGWKNIASTTVQHSCLGTIKSKLKSKMIDCPDRYKEVNKWLPTTKLCPICGQRKNISLDERTYICDCGYREDRDIHAAKNVLMFATC